MAQVQDNDVVSRTYRGPDRRGHNILNRVARFSINLTRNRWVAMFIVAFAVSWCFHAVERRSDAKIEQHQKVLICTVTGVADTQAAQPNPAQRVDVRSILVSCEHREHK